MYCPKCSQKQSADGLRFCSRCGFHLGVVKELLAERDSSTIMTADPQPRTKFFSRRKQDLLLGATVMSVVATLIVQISWLAPKEAIIFPLWLIWFLFSLFVLFFGSLARVARRLFSDDDDGSDLPLRRRTPSFPTNVSSATGEFPAVQNVPVAALGSERLSTGEILQPLSVTDHTTSLLDKK